MEKYIPPRPDCPNCGKKNGAVMGSSNWRHNIICCSDECGMAIKEKLKKNTSNKEYEKAESKYHKAKRVLKNLKYKGIPLNEPGPWDWE
jgi:hypothetical protein